MIKPIVITAIVVVGLLLATAMVCATAWEINRENCELARELKPLPNGANILLNEAKPKSEEVE